MSKFNSVNNLPSIAVLSIFQLYKYLVFYSQDYSYFKFHAQLVFLYKLIWSNILLSLEPGLNTDFTQYE